MKSMRVALLALASCATLTLMSCRDTGPVAPVATVQDAAAPGQLLDGAVDLLSKTATGLLSCRKMPAAWASATIGKNGGRIDVGPHYLVIPSGALNSTVTITAYAPSDEVNRVHFEPHGLEFKKAASLTMSYANCKGISSMTPKRIAYVNDLLSILYYLPSIDDFASQTVTGTLEHFSDYALSW